MGVVGMEQREQEFLGTRFVGEQNLLGIELSLKKKVQNKKFCGICGNKLRTFFDDELVFIFCSNCNFLEVIPCNMKYYDKYVFVTLK